MRICSVWFLTALKSRKHYSAPTCGHVRVQARAVAQELAQLEQLRVAAVRLRQRLHPLQQRLAPHVAWAGYNLR